MRLVALILLGWLLAACARTPPVTINYPLARSALHVDVTQTFGCDAAYTPVVVNTVTPTMLHTADPSPEAMRSIDLSQVDGPLSNSEFKTDFYADGRLKAINLTTTGQGEAIFKTAIELLPLFAEAPAGVNPEEKCKKFREKFADKVVTLTYELVDTLVPSRQLIPIQPDHASKPHYELYKDLVGALCLQVPRTLPAKLPPATYPTAGGFVTVVARQPALVEVAVTAGSANDCGATVLWSGLVPAGQHGIEYKIPVPRAAFFGKQVFGAAFEESGALSQLTYNKDTGAGPLLNVIQAGAKEIDTTDEERATKLKAKADLIAAQQRLVRCQITPSAC